MKDKQNNKDIDKNFFEAMNYEIAAENGVIDNEEMKSNKGLEEARKLLENRKSKFE